MALSPDGSRLAVRVQESPKGPADLWLKPLGRAPASKLTFSGAVGGRPSWSTDGAEVRFLSADSMTRVLTVRADGTGQPRLLVRHPRGVYEMEPTPDGKALLVRVGSIPSGEIMLARLSDTTVQPLLPSGANQRAPTISPDGRWLAYVSDESGRGEIFVRPFPNVTDGRWQVSREGGIEPRWAHSGRELYYRAPGRAGPGSMMAAELLTAPTFTVTGVQRLFTDSFLSDASHSLYAVARDDRRFLLWHRVGRGNDTPSSLVLAEHWLGPAIREATRR
jgi:serine/threonine-protein kinase